MSGGHFEYKQHQIEDIASEIERIVQTGGKNISEYDTTILSPETLIRFQEAVLALRRAAHMAERIDYLLSGDDGEETFHERWNEKP